MAPRSSRDESGGEDDSTDGTGAAAKPSARHRSIWTTFGLRLPPELAEPNRWFQRSRETFALARQVSMSSRSHEDSALLLQKSIYQLFVSTLVGEGKTVASYEQCRERISGRPELAKLFADVVEELSFLEQLVGSFELVRDDTSEVRSRYDALLQRLPSIHRAVRRHLDGRSRKAGVDPSVRRVAIGAAIPLACVVVALIAYRSCANAPSSELPLEAAPPPADPAPPSQVAPAPATDASKCFKATYFSSPNFETPVHTRQDCAIDFDWADEPVEGVPNLPTDGFSVRWEGWLHVPARDQYLFYLTSDDGSRMYLNDELIVDNWGEHALGDRVSAPQQLDDGVDYPVRIEFFDAAGAAIVRLEWASEGMTKSPLGGDYIRQATGSTPLALATESEDLLADSSKCFTGRYFVGKELAGQSTTRRDCRIGFFWGLDGPGLEGVPADGFSVRWEGKLRPPADGDYTFHLGSDDGSRLYLDDKLLIDQWSMQAFTERSHEPVRLSKDRDYPLRVEYFEDEGGAEVRLLWESAAMPKRPLSGRYITPVSPPAPDPAAAP